MIDRIVAVGMVGAVVLACIGMVAFTAGDFIENKIMSAVGGIFMGLAILCAMIEFIAAALSIASSLFEK